MHAPRRRSHRLAGLRHGFVACGLDRRSGLLDSFGTVRDGFQEGGQEILGERPCRRLDLFGGGAILEVGKVASLEVQIQIAPDQRHAGEVKLDELLLVQRQTVRPEVEAVVLHAAPAVRLPLQLEAQDVACQLQPLDPVDSHRQVAELAKS